MKAVEKAKSAKNESMEQNQHIGIQEDVNLGESEIEKKVEKETDYQNLR